MTEQWYCPYCGFSFSLEEQDVIRLHATGSIECENCHRDINIEDVGLEGKLDGTSY